MSRDALHAQLVGLLASTEREPGGLVVVSGEAGIGKSTAVRRLATSSRGRVLWGACEPLASTRPLLPLHDWAREAGGDLAAAMAADDSRHDLFTVALEALATPTLAVVEDVHWADDATLDLLVYLGRRLATLPSTLVLTAREVPARLAGLGRRVVVPPLTADEVAQLTADSGLDAERVHTITGGNAFFVTQLLGAPTAGVPDSVREAVLARVQVLSDSARAVVETAAVAPHCAELPLLYDAAGAGPQDVEEAERSGLVSCDGREVVFRHELAREAVETAMPGSRLHERHVAVLGELVHRHPTRDASLAYHAHFADDHARALVHGLRAARRSMRQGAWREARTQLERAGEHLDHAEPRLAVEILRAHVDTLTAGGAHQQALPLSERAVALARDLGEPDLLAGELARHAFGLWRLGGSASSRSLVDEALEVGRAAPESAGNLWGLLASASLRMLTREIERSLVDGRAAVALARRLGDRRGLAEALHVVGTASWFAVPEEAEPRLVQALELATAIGDDRLAGLVMVNAGSGSGEVRRYTQAQRWLERCHAFAVERDLDDQSPYALAWLARIALEQGDLDAAVARARQCLDAPDLIARIGAHTVLGRAGHRLGTPGSRQHLDAAWALAEPTGDLQRTWPIVAGYAEAGVTDRLPALLEQAVALGQAWAIGELGWQAVQAGVVAADDTRLGAAAAPYASMIRGEWATAARAWQDLGCRYDAAVAEGLSDEPALLRKAIATLDALGARADADRVAARLRALDGSTVRRARRSTAAHPFGLTDRELEVATLLRDGLTNAEIAERTFTSAKTVGHHVSAILAKVGVASRRDAVSRIWGGAPDSSPASGRPRSEA